MTRQELILATAKEAGTAIRSISPSNTTKVTKEGTNNFFTLADKASEDIIFRRIRENFPADLVLSEETVSDLSSEQILKAPYLWIIDPIDGTVEYQHDRKYSCVSIGYAEKGILTLAVVYDPFREELFTAEKGKGAYRNEKRVQVSSNTSLDHATIYSTNSYDPAIFREHLKTILKLDPLPWFQIKGSAALMMSEIASGQTDLYYSFCMKPWDNAAAFLLLQESGAVAVDRLGKPVDFLSPTVIAGNPTLVQKFVEAIR